MMSLSKAAIVVMLAATGLSSISCSIVLRYEPEPTEAGEGGRRAPDVLSIHEPRLVEQKHIENLTENIYQYQPGEVLVAHARDVETGESLVFVVAVPKRSVCVYAYRGGRLALVAARKIHWDLRVAMYNSEPSVDEIRKGTEIAKKNTPEMYPELQRISKTVVPRGDKGVVIEAGECPGTGGDNLYVIDCETKTMGVYQVRSYELRLVAVRNIDYDADIIDLRSEPAVREIKEGNDRRRRMPGEIAPESPPVIEGEKEPEQK